MLLLQEPGEFARACDEARGQQQRVGLVPTMGALHEGHLSLMREARQRSDFLAATIFVNPTQFGPNEDLSRYPRDLDGDLEKCRSVGVDLVFAPDVAAMYPKGEQTRVTTGTLGNGLCGAARPGHFTGVCTVVSKLFNLSGPCVAVFGKKDYQQLRIIDRMVTDLFAPIEIVEHPIVREADGLAMSSRNRYLSQEERARALSIARGLNQARSLWEVGERSASSLTGACKASIEEAGLQLDYVELVDAETLQPLGSDEATAAAASVNKALLAAAAFAGKTRLIDNLVLGEDPPIKHV